VTAAPIRALVVDDERLARTGLVAMLAGDADLVVEECARGADAARIIRERAIDLVFLDVKMPKVGGFDVIAALPPERMPVVVLTTAYSEHALRAFEARVFEYLVKPIAEARLAQAVQRAKGEIRQRRLAAIAANLESSGDQRLLIRSGAATYYVDVNDIDWVEAESYYARLWTGARSHLIRETLASLAASLDARRFVRVHRSAIVNITRVSGIRRLEGGRYGVILDNGARVTLSRDRKAALLDALAMPGAG
jgi:two-component system LytT family response regulator